MLHIADATTEAIKTGGIEKAALFDTTEIHSVEAVKYALAS